jgi:hypothetical protein
VSRSESPTGCPIEPGALVVPTHGNGRLRHGSQPGTNRGGTGAPPSELRKRLRGSLEERIQVAEEIADGAQFSAADRLRALDLMARYGLGTQKEITVEHVKSKLAETISCIRQTLPEHQANALLEKLRPIWS